MSSNLCILRLKLDIKLPFSLLQPLYIEVFSEPLLTMNHNAIPTAILKKDELSLAYRFF